MIYRSFDTYKEAGLAACLQISKKNLFAQPVSTFFFIVFSFYVRYCKLSFLCECKLKIDFLNFIKLNNFHIEELWFLFSYK